MGRRRGPFHAHRAASSPHLDPDGTTRRVRRRRYRYKVRCAIEGASRSSAAYRNGDPASFRLFDPAAHYTRVQTARQGYGCNRHARLLAFANRLRLEQLTMASATPTTSPDYLSRSVHVYTYRAY